MRQGRRRSATTTRIGLVGSGELFVMQGITKSFGGVKPTQEVSFRLQRVHALIGPNDPRKSTLINMLTSLIEPTEGSIRFLDQEISGRPVFDLLHGHGADLPGCCHGLLAPWCGLRRRRPRVM